MESRGGATEADPQGIDYLKNDRIEKGQGIQASIGVSGVYEKWRLNAADVKVNADYTSNIWDKHPFYWSPILEMQWKNKDGIEPLSSSTASNTPLDGNVTRSKLGIAVSIWPFMEQMKQRLELTARYEVWLNLNRSGYFTTYNRTQRITTLGLNIWLNTDRNAGIGLDYFNGENPETGKVRDRSTEVAFKLQF